MDISVKYSGFIGSRKKIIHRGRIMGYSRNKKWIGKLVDMGVIRTKYGTNPRDFKEAFKDKLFKIMDILENKYGNSWDLHLEKASYTSAEECYISILIHYRRVIITNYDTAMSRELRDLIVAIPLEFDADNVWLSRVQGMRATLSYEEAESNYRHSHLRSVHHDNIGYSSAFETGEFCIGAAGELPFVEGQLEHEFNEEMFEYYFYCLDTMVMCESETGGPHYRMRGIMSNGQHLDNGVCRNIANGYIIKPLLAEKKIDLDFYISEGRYKIKPNEKLESKVRQLLRNNPDSLHKILVKGSPTRGYVNYSGYKKSKPDYDKQYHAVNAKGQVACTYIAGVKIEMKVYKERYIDVTPNIDEFFIYPYFLEYVCRELESHIYKASIRGSGINRYYNSSNNATGVPGQS